MLKQKELFIDKTTKKTSESNLFPEIFHFVQHCFFGGYVHHTYQKFPRYGCYYKGKTRIYQNEKGSTKIDVFFEDGEIRSSEKRFYEKVKEIFKTSVDYDKDDET